MTMSQTSRRAVLGLLGAAPIAAGTVLTVPGAAHATDSPQGDRSVPRSLRPGGELDQLISRLAAGDHFSGTVLVKRRNHTALSRSHGMANRDAEIPNGPDTRFALGSITKLFTSVAVAQLVQAGDVAYHERLGAYLDGFRAEVAENVTIHQLLTHTSGMGDFYRVPGYVDESRGWETAEDVLGGTMTYIRNSELEYAPRASYSNSGYVVLGAIVQEVSGRSYYDYVRDHVFEAAGMTGAAFVTRPERLEDTGIARSYETLPSGERADSIDKQAFIGLPAGGSYANADDLVAFENALLGDDLLEAPHTHIVLSPKTPVPSEPGEVTFGTYASVATLAGGQWAFGAHGGSTEGVSADLDWYPDSDWVVVVLSNYQDATDEITTRARELIVG
jgi:CubicO group peptidase (beta-lactamase class C family)